MSRQHLPERDRPTGDPPPGFDRAAASRAVLSMLIDGQGFGLAGIAPADASQRAAELSRWLAAGSRMARDLARDLGQAGYVIVSGMARGVDGEAHGAAMETGTVAAIAGGIDQIYPPQHEQLYGILAQRGCLVSESPFGYVAQARDFPKRNRVISGLSLATIVVEAADRSGSLITARFALEQGREVMAVPGSPLDPRARGANRLLKQGAALIESAEDVLHEMEGIAPPTFDEPFADRFDARDADVPPALLRAVREALSPTPKRSRTSCSASTSKTPKSSLGS